jgi:hypothetical protein
VAETALVLMVPEAEPVVGSFRATHDSSARVGVPAHVTLLYPFLSPDAVGAAQVSALEALFAATRPFDTSFRRCARFTPHVLYLAPEPAAPIRDLMRRIWRQWPECPPYGGMIPADVVAPHLTVSDSVTGDDLDRIELVVSSGLPVRTRFTEACLMEERTGRWTVRNRFPFG